MNLDALESSHPVSVVVHHPSEIAEIFDVISYQKGAAIIRMLASFIGEDNFKKALFNFLDKRYVKMTNNKYPFPSTICLLHLLFVSLSSQYGNAVQDDLWNAFDNQAKVDHIILPANVKTIMDTWTLKMGITTTFL
jgi:aminopeptidase N